MKTCKTGCGKMQAGGSVKKVKKMQKGGSADMLGMPQYDNDPRTYSGRMAKKGGTIKKYQDGGDFKKKPALYTKSAKAGVGIIGSGLLGIASKFVVDKIKEKNAAKAAKKAAEEKKKKETTKAKFGSSVPVKHNPPKGMRHDSEHKGYESVAKAQKGGTLKTVPADKVGLAKLPTAVRNKMGYKQKGGSVKKK